MQPTPEQVEQIIHDFNKAFRALEWIRDELSYGTLESAFTDNVWWSAKEAKTRAKNTIGAINATAEQRGE